MCDKRNKRIILHNLCILLQKWRSVLFFEKKGCRLKTNIRAKQGKPCDAKL